MKNEDIDYLDLPDHLHVRDGDNMPELIRIDPQLGYVKGNVVVVSRRAAVFTQFYRAVCAEPHELRQFADLIDDGAVIL